MASLRTAVWLVAVVLIGCGRGDSVPSVTETDGTNHKKVDPAAGTAAAFEALLDARKENRELRSRLEESQSRNQIPVLNVTTDEILAGLSKSFSVEKSGRDHWAAVAGEASVIVSPIGDNSGAIKKVILTGNKEDIQQIGRVFAAIMNTVEPLACKDRASVAAWVDRAIPFAKNNEDSKVETSFGWHVARLSASGWAEKNGSGLVSILIKPSS